MVIKRKGLIPLSETAHGYLAQLVERLTVNQIVVGLIPSISVASYG